MNSRKIINGLVVVCVFLCFPCTAIPLVVGGGAFVAGAAQEPENVDIGVHAPTVVAKGESFVIKVQVENLADEPQSLDSIDIGLEYLDGIDILTTKPLFVELSASRGFQSYYFRRGIPPGDTLVVQIFAVGHDAGDFSGEIFDVCINSPFSCSSFVIRTVVGE